MSPLHILEVKTLLVASFANIFSQFIGCLFILFMVAFATGIEYQNARAGNDYTMFVQLYAPISSGVVSNRWA